LRAGSRSETFAICTPASTGAPTERGRRGGVHPEGGRAAATARRCRSGGQAPSTCRRRGTERRLRDGLSRLLLRGSARAQPATGGGCARDRDPAEEGELGARCGHPWLLRRHRPRWLLRFLEHRIADRRVVRLIRKWLKAGVIENGEWSETREGTAQGA